MRKLAVTAIFLMLLVTFSGCVQGQSQDELERLREENLRLQGELEMQRQTATPLPVTTESPTTQPPTTTTQPTTTPPPTTAAPKIVDVTGLWVGTAQSSGCPRSSWTWTASLFQSGTKVTGSFNAGGQTFDVSGSFSGTKLFISSTRNDIPTSLSGTVDGTSWTGTYTAAYPNSLACPYEQITQGTFEGQLS